MPRILPTETELRQVAFTRTELLACLAVIFVLTGILMISYSGFRQRRASDKCVDNLKNIGLACRIWSTDGGDDFPFQRSVKGNGTREFTNVWQQFQALSYELRLTTILVCPGSTNRPARTWRTLRDENISYFISLSAAKTYPQSLLCGDSSFLINGQPPQMNPVRLTNGTTMSYPASVHGGGGNIAMGDGSVQKLSNARLKVQLQNTGIETNTLLFPR